MRLLLCREFSKGILQLFFQLMIFVCLIDLLLQRITLDLQLAQFCGQCLVRVVIPLNDRLQHRLYLALWQKVFLRLFQLFIQKQIPTKNRAFQNTCNALAKISALLALFGSVFLQSVLQRLINAGMKNM